MSNKIYIGTPTRYGDIHHLQTQALIQGVHALIENGNKVNYISVPHIITDVARNVVVAKFLASGFDYLIFLDNDVIFNPKDLFKLVNFPSSYKVISGIYARKGSSGNDGNFSHILEEETNKSIAKAKFTGGGFLRIHKSVFQKIDDEAESFRHPAVLDDEMEYLKTYFDSHFENNQFISEDVDFCNKCHNKGIDIYVDQNLRVGHSFHTIN